jgi:hypothetical protein
MFLRDPVHTLRITACAALFAALMPGIGVSAQAANALSLPMLTPTERVSVRQIVVNDARVRSLIGAGTARVIVGEAEVDKAEAERYLSGQSTMPPTRRVALLVFNPATNHAARTLVVLGTPRIESVERIDPADVPLTKEDAVGALALAKGNADIRRIVGDTIDRYVIAEPGLDAGGPFVAEALPLLSGNPQDPCHADRCLDVIFRGEHGYLPVRAHADITKQSITVEGGRR